MKTTIMLFACNIVNILANVLPSLRIIPLLLIRIIPLLLIRIATIALLYAAALLFYVVYIQPIESGIGILSELFILPGFEISPWLLLSSLLPVKPKRLTALDRSNVSLN
jgi:hypothetical protein